MDAGEDNSLCSTPDDQLDELLHSRCRCVREISSTSINGVARADVYTAGTSVSQFNDVTYRSYSLLS